VEVHAERIEGPWTEGFVLDRHVVSSRPIGYLGEHMQFDTTRSALGELVYQLKYRNGNQNDIVETAIAFITERWSRLIDGVVAPPPSLHRLTQPAVLIAERIRRESGGAVLCVDCDQGDGHAADEERSVVRARPAVVGGHPAGHRRGPRPAGLARR
jgi:hypothetical protein